MPNNNNNESIVAGKFLMKQFNALTNALVHIKDFDRNAAKAEWKALDEKTVFSLPTLNTVFDRKITFHLMPLLEPYNPYRLCVYADILEYVKAMDRQHAFNFNEILALYNPADGYTWFGFAPIHKTIAIDVGGKLKVSPFLPY